MARIPRRRTDAPFLTAYSTVKPSKVSTVTFEKSAVMASSIFRGLDAEQGILFGIAEDGDRQLVKYLAAALDQVQMAVGRW